MVDIAAKKCEHSTPRHEFHRIGASEDYHLVGEYAIGAPPEDGVEIRVYHKYENSTSQVG